MSGLSYYYGSLPGWMAEKYARLVREEWEQKYAEESFGSSVGPAEAEGAQDDDGQPTPAAQ